MLTRRKQQRLNRVDLDQAPALAARNLLDYLYDLRPDYLDRKVLQQARRAGGVLAHGIAATESLVR